MTGERTDIDVNDGRIEPIRDEDVKSLVDNLEADGHDVDVRVDVAEASEQIGTGTDR